MMDILDQKILRYVEQVPGMTPANNMQLEDTAKKTNPGSIPWRVVDYRTRRLKKQGYIEYRNRRWVLTNKAKPQAYTQ